jgi:uncharacterized protein
MNKQDTGAEINLGALTEDLERELLASCDGSDASHDIHHSRRVLSSALRIAAMEGGADELVLTAAAYLHDIVNLPKNSPDRAQASRLSAAAAAPILARNDFPQARIAAVQHAIEAHSFSANIPPTTLEAKILQDADRLEAVGAIGIARVFYIAGKLDTALFDGGDAFAQERELDDRRFAVDHFEVKLLRLEETMQTDAGRRIARERTEVMRQFLRQLGTELGQECSW